MCTHPPTPRAKVLQRVGDDLHAITKHAIQIEFLVLVYHGRQEEDQAAAGLQEIPCEGDEVDCECRQLVRFSGWHIRLVIPRNGQIMSEDCSDMGVRTRVIVEEQRNQLPAPFCGQDALRLLGRHLSEINILPKVVFYCISGEANLQGGSVMMASKSPPHLQGFRVTSKVHRSKMRCRVPY